MKKYINLYALLAMALFAGISCTDRLESTDEPVKIVPGEEIKFGASAYNRKNTRTVYGNVTEDKSLVEVYWEEGDFITIGSPNTAGRDTASYVVKDAIAPSIDGGNSQATTLDRIGDVGLQWGTDKDYRFIAMYPAQGSFKTGELAGEMNLNVPDRKMRGWLPVSQPPKSIPTPSTVNGAKIYDVKPDMRYAYMVADTNYCIYEKDKNGEIIYEGGLPKANEDKVNLVFNSLVTALEFKIKPCDLWVNSGNTAALKSKNVEIQSVTLSSADKTPICGGFEYIFDTKTVSTTTAGATTNSITIDLLSAKENGKAVPLAVAETSITDTQTGNNTTTTYVKYAGNDELSVTFFLLPNFAQEQGAGNLLLNVMYKVNGVLYGKTATINAAIEPGKKHSFTNVRLPKVYVGGGAIEAEGSNWFSLLNDNIYVSQLSFAVAGNAFSNKSAAQYKEQVMDYEALWNYGVRGFEICTYNINDLKTSSIATGPIVSGGAAVSGLNVKTVFENLYSKLGNETLLVIFNGRHTTGYGSFNPDVFVAQIENYLDDFMGRVVNKKDDGTPETNDANWDVKREDLFARLGSESCVGDLKGKIAVIVRPGDNDYVKALGKNSAQVSEKWSNCITVIDDWGTSEDQWGDRYGNFYDQASYSNAGGKSIFENQHLKYRVDTQRAFSGSWNNGEESGSFPTAVLAENKNYGRIVNSKIVDGAETSTDIAYVQCWERVVQSETGLKEVVGSDGGTFSTKYRLHIGWFASYLEKTAMAEYILGEAMGKVGQSHSPLYINSLCGFFIDDNVNFSYMPNLDGTPFGGHNFTPSKSGTGGDFKSCAANLNYWLWNKLKNTTAKGPYGVIMLDYIGATDMSNIVPVESGITSELAAQACQELPMLIMSNNFKFTLAADPDYGKEKTIPTLKFSDELLNTDNEVLDWK